MAENLVGIGAVGQQIGSAVATGQNSNVVDFFSVRKDFGVQVNYSGTITTASIQLQGSIDGTNFFNIGSAYTTTTSGYFAVTNQPVRFVRVAVTITGGGNASLFLAAL